jgi:NAD(P)-dependent dehydrogenase (short-subunit alcohol dehydrogenase family)
MADMRCKVVLISGATNGIGRVTALELARLGATTVIAGRNASKVSSTVDMIRQFSGQAQVSGLVADLSVQAQVRALADAFKRQYDRLDVLVNNAGAAFHRRVLTPDGIEATFALNHLSYYLLTHLLLDRLQASAPARIINVASDAHRYARADSKNWQSEYDYGPTGFGAYSRTKLANILFTRELARRLAGTGVTANALHPGTVATGIWRNTGGVLGHLIGMMSPLVMRTPEQGAQTTIYLASSPTVAGISGLYFVDSKPISPSKAAQDDDAARQLWALSEQMTGMTQTVGV